MNYAGLMTNDFSDGEGVCVSYWTQGCPHRCPGCHNPQTWDFCGGAPVPADIKEKIFQAIEANGIKRNFSVLGGEPLCAENISFVANLIMEVRKKYKDIKIFLWTGYTIEELKKDPQKKKEMKEILDNIDILIEGRYVDTLRDVSLKLRGSSNQRILKKGIDF